MCTASAYSILICIYIIVIITILLLLLYYYNYVYILNRIVVGLISCIAQLGNISLNFELTHFLGVNKYFLLYSDRPQSCFSHIFIYLHIINIMLIIFNILRYIYSIFYILFI